MTDAVSNIYLKIDTAVEVIENTDLKYPKMIYDLYNSSVESVLEITSDDAKDKNFFNSFGKENILRLAVVREVESYINIHTKRELISSLKDLRKSIYLNLN